MVAYAYVYLCVMNMDKYDYKDNDAMFYHYRFFFFGEDVLPTFCTTFWSAMKKMIRWFWNDEKCQN